MVTRVAELRRRSKRYDVLASSEAFCSYSMDEASAGGVVTILATGARENGFCGFDSDPAIGSSDKES